VAAKCARANACRQPASFDTDNDPNTEKRLNGCPMYLHEYFKGSLPQATQQFPECQKTDEIYTVGTDSAIRSALFHHLVPHPWQLLTASKPA